MTPGDALALIGIVGLVCLFLAVLYDR
jgi:hypothetical protein